MNAQGVISVCVSIWTHMYLKTKHFAKKSFCWVCRLCYDYFWNHQIIVLCCWTWKTICLSHAFRNPITVWVVTSLATASLLSSGKVWLDINQVSTLSCNQTCGFVQHRCNWNVWWLVLALHQRWTARVYNVLIQQQLLTEELFSQLPMYVLLKHHRNNKMKRRLSTWLLH